MVESSWYRTEVALAIAYDNCTLFKTFSFNVILGVVYLCIAHIFTNLNWIELAVVAFA